MKILPCIAFLLLTSSLWAQTSATNTLNLHLPTVALLDIAPNGGSITLSLNTPNEAGSPLTGTNDSSKWLNLTSAVASGSSRYITAHLSAGNIPAGLGLRFTTTAYSGNGAGALGSGGGSILLNSLPQTIVSGIGGAYTGDGTGNGYNLNYALEIQNYAQLQHDLSTVITVTFTFVDL